MSNASVRKAVPLLLIFVIGLLAYSNTFHGPFQWDEEDYLLENPVIRDLDYFLHPARSIGILNNALISRYIGFLTFALNYRGHDFDVFGYHVVNLAIHIINAMLVYFFIALTLRTPYFEGRGSKGEGRDASRFFPLAVALLFVAHPVQTEAVTYVFQRFASLVSMFYLLSLVLYIKGRQSAISDQQSDDSPLKKGARGLSFLYYFLSFLSAVLAMKTKENAFTLPVIISLYEFLFFTGPLKPRALRLVPFLATMLIIPLTTIITDSVYTIGEIIGQMKATDPDFSYQELSRSEYFLTQFRVILTYIRLLFLPVNQNIHYDYPAYRSFFDMPVFLSFFFLASLFGTAVYLLFKSRAISSQQSAISNTPPQSPLNLRGDKGGLLNVSREQKGSYRLIAFGILWFFITLSVESSVIPIPILIAEYRLYLPSVGFFLALASAVLLFFQRFPGASPQRQKVVVVVFGTIVLALASATYARNNLWKDKIALWEDAARKSPESARPHYNLGLAYDTSGHIDEAIHEYLITLSLAPQKEYAHTNLGIAYVKKGWGDKALEQFETALKIKPDDPSVHANLGNAYAMTGSVDKGIEHWEIAVLLKPDYYEPYFNLGKAYEQKKLYEKAIREFMAASRIRPEDVISRYHLGRAYANAGRPDEAIEQFTAVVSLRPDNASYHNILGVLYGQKGLIDQAVEQFSSAVRLAPDKPSYRQNLDRAMQQKDSEEKGK